MFLFQIRSLIDLCRELNIDFEFPEFLVQDASRAEYNAALRVFGENSTVLMCWYHVMANIRKVETRKLIPVHLYESVQADIRFLHFSLEHEYNANLKTVLAKWALHKSLDDFVRYFTNQWLSEPFNNWQIFHTPPGFASTANPIESFNNLLKKVFTQRQVLSIDDFFDLMIKSVIPWCSRNSIP